MKLKRKKKKGAKKQTDTGVTPLGETILEVVENQIREGNPQEVGETLDRLIELGLTREKAMHQIGSVFAIEIWETMSKNTEFNEQRYIENLRNLPELPEELR